MPPLAPLAGKASIRLLALVWLAVELLLPAQLLAQSWEPVMQEGNLQISRRAYPGSPLQEIRGVTRVKASLNAVMALLKDADFNRQWVYRSGGARILEEEGYARAYVYGIVDAPWPMQDRDTVVRFGYSQDADSAIITITIENFPEHIPSDERYVRVPDFGGFWALRPRADGWVEITYQVYGDPGGWVPVWVANFAAVTSVTRTLQNMAEAVQHYRAAQSPYVKELSTVARSAKQ